MAAGFEDVVEAYHVGLDIGIGVLDAVADSCLCGKVYYDVEVILGKKGIDGGFVSDVAFYELIMKV